MLGHTTNGLHIYSLKPVRCAEKMTGDWLLCLL